MRLIATLLLPACAPSTSASVTPPPVESCGEREADWDGATLAVAAEGCGEVFLEPRVIGDGDWSVDLTQLDDGTWQPTVSGTGTFEGLVMEGSFEVVGADELVFWRQGYQSWSWSGVTEPGSPRYDDDGVIRAEGDGDGATVFIENAATSWWVGLLGRHEGGSLLAGARSAERTKFTIGVDDALLQLVWGTRGERISLDEASIELDPVWLDLAPDPIELHDAYAEVVGVAAGIAPPRGTPPVGWATWYQYYSEVTEEDVRHNLDALEELDLDGLSDVELFQVDDGWQVTWGDWTAGEDFPSGMAALAADIEAAGMTPGLWMAPFYVSTTTDTYADHPEWFVRDDDGEHITFTNLGTGDYAILDASQDAVLDWLEALIADKVAEGWTYLKLDFLYAGAQEGERAEAITGMEAYHRGMERMRAAAGDAWILACGAPMLPSVGYADSFRTGSDIAFESDPDPKQGFYRWQARATAARAWTHGRWWWIDPDQLVIREPLDEAQVRGALVSGVVAGGTWLLGDDLVVLDEERLALALDPALTALLGGQSVPTDPLRSVSVLDGGPIVEASLADDVVPTRWELEDGTVALLNLGEASVEVDGPGGVELLTGAVADAGSRTLAPGDGELWQPVDR